MNNPSQIPGLAHLLEHMLFTRNQKNPTPYGFSNFAISHAGSFLAETELSYTRYYMTVQENVLKEGLEQ